MPSKKNSSKSGAGPTSRAKPDDAGASKTRDAAVAGGASASPTVGPGGATGVYAVEKERSNFTQLILSNPNYFGNLADSQFKAVQKIVGNPKYEEIGCIGFNHHLNTLEATIKIKLPTGYSGNLCSAGSTEYVRFYVDYGSGWQDAGMTGVNVHDIPNVKDCAQLPDKPLCYVVSLHFEPKRDCCKTPVLPNVRAVLSWNQPPPASTPNWPPVWGNVRDRHIQIPPRPCLFSDLFKDSTIDLSELLKQVPGLELIKEHPIPVEKLGLPSLGEVAKKYTLPKGKGIESGLAQTSVEPHRFGAPHLLAAMQAPPTLDAAMNYTAVWQSVGLDFQAALNAFNQTSNNVSYEQLDCLGLNYDNDRVVATLTVKKPNGYSGDLCGKGSDEYVAFWADWDNTCEWTYLGTQSVTVHDITSIPADGLHYAVIQPGLLDAHRQSCKKPKIARLRAVLSWATPPSNTDPDAIPYWGNRVDVHVQIKPGKPTNPGDPPTAQLEAMGGINIEDINTNTNGMTKPSAKFSNNPVFFADEWSPHLRECPFGGYVWFEGKYYPGYKYRISVQRTTDPADLWTNIVNGFDVNKFGPGVEAQIAEAGGFFTFKDPALFADFKLTYWPTSGDEIWRVRYEIAELLDPESNVVDTSYYLIQLDNTEPDAGIQLDFGGDCKDFEVETVLNGHFVATDEHFGAFSLQTLPNTATIPSNQPMTATPSTTATAPRIPLGGLDWTGGDAWQINTKIPILMKPCGYVVHVDVSDRTVLHSTPFAHNTNSSDTGLCLRAKMPT